MIWLLITNIVLIALGAFIWVVMALRWSHLKDYRLSMLDQLSRCAYFDRLMKNEWQWRYEAYNQASIQRQLWMFWKPFDSAWPDLSFIEVNSVKPEWVKEKPKHYLSRYS